jgi:hypothetical protein
VDGAARVRSLKILLRLGGALTGSAFAAMLLPTDWMASTHARLGLGEFPRVPVVQYLTRSIAALYGFHGVLLFLLASDPLRFRPLVTYVAAFNILFGVMLVGIDLHAGMPWWWTAGEGPWIVVMGALLAMLNRDTGEGRQ